LSGRFSRGKRDKGVRDWQKPVEDSELVKSWDERISVYAEVATTLRQSAASQPGMTPTLMQSLFPKKTEAEMVANTNLRASVAEQTVKATTTKLTSAQEVYKSTMALHQSMNEQKLKMQEELTKAEAEVAKLQAQGVTAANVGKVFVQCIGFLAQLKSKIASFVEFLSKISILVKSIVTSQIKSIQDTHDVPMAQRQITFSRIRCRSWRSSPSVATWQSRIPKSTTSVSSPVCTSSTNAASLPIRWWKR
jgi:hypothetical protein